MRVVVLVLLLGCGRAKFDPLAGDATGVSDVAGDASCACRDVHPLLDDFDRPDGDPGPMWTGDKTAFALVGGALQANGTGLLVWDGAAPAAVQTASVRYVGGSEQELGLALDIQPNGDRIYIVYHETTNGSHSHVGTNIGGQATDVGGDLPFVFDPGDRIGGTLHANGTVDIVRNGVVLGTYAVTWPYAGQPGSLGISSYYPAATATVDDLEGGACCD